MLSENLVLLNTLKAHMNARPCQATLTIQETPKVTTKRVSLPQGWPHRGHKRSLANFYLQTLHITPSRWMRKAVAGAASHRGTPILSWGNELGSFEQMN